MMPVVQGADASGRSLATAPLPLQRAAAVAALRHRPQSRTELAEELGLSASVVSRLVGRLLQDSILREVGVEANGLGRPRTTLGIEPSAGLLASVILGRDAVDAHLVDVTGEVVRADRLPIETTQRLEPQMIVDFLAGLVDPQDGHAPLWGIGVSAPGVVDAAGSISAAPDLGWVDPVPLLPLLRERFGGVVTVDNDVNLMILAEAAMGWARDTSDAALLYLGRKGMGLGIIANHALLAGARGASGEIGLLPVPHRGGAPRPFEEVYSSDAVASVLRAEGLDVGVDPMAQLVTAADNGVAKDFLQSLLVSFTQVLGIVSLILNPEVIVIGGALRTLCQGREQDLEGSLATWLPSPPAVRLSQLGQQELHWAAQRQCWERIIAAGV